MILYKRWKNVHIAVVFVMLFSLIVPLGNQTVDAAQIEGESQKFIQISAGGEHALALKADGTVVGWGDNSQGQLNIPAGLSDVVSISAGFYHSLALKADGTVVGWGRNLEGQVSVPAGLTGVKSIAAGVIHTLALKKDGTVVTWGENYQGVTNVPTGLNDVVSIASGAYHSMAVKSDGTVVAWGKVDEGQTNVGGLTDVVSIATGSISYHSIALKADGTVVAWGTNSEGSATIPSGLLNVVAVATGLYHSLVLKADGTVAAWGRNNHGQSTVPPGLSDVVSITAGEHFSLALKSDGTVVAWGSNNYGKTTVPAALSLPVKGNRIAGGKSNSLALISNGTIVGWGNDSTGQNNVPTGLSNVVSIALGDSHALALQSDGTVVGWGANDIGQASVPGGLIGVKSIAAGNNHSLALKSEGTIVGWGDNNFGQTTIPSGLLNVVALAAGGNFSLALKSDSTVAGWGGNGYGQLNIPVGLTGVVALAAGENFSLALKSDGTVVGWGSNTLNQISVPAGVTGVVAISTGDAHSLALKSDGTLVGWGDNTFGQASVPTGLSEVVAIAAGSDHSLALKADGTVVGWGRNNNGQRTIPGNDSLNALTLLEGDFNEPFQSSNTTYTAYFKDTLPNSTNLTATLNSKPLADLYVNNERFTSGSTVTINIPGAPTSFAIPVRVEPYLKHSKTYMVTLAIDETKPSVQFVANGHAAVAQSAASAVTVSDTESGIDSASLQYVWTQSTAVPAGGWNTFNNGDTLGQTSGNGNWYLHVRASDKVGNVINAVSNSFVLDNTAPTATVSTSAGSTANAAFPVTINFSENINGFTEDDLVIDNGSLSDFVSVTSATYTATVNPLASGRAVTVTVGAGAVIDEVGNPNTASNTLSLMYDTTKPAVTFGSFADGQRFIVQPAAVTVSVSEAVYWVAGGAELSAANALPLISMKKDGHAFSGYTPSYDEPSQTYTLSFNGTLSDGDYEVLVAGDVVKNGYHNTLEAASASFTVAVPVISGISANPTSLASTGGNTIATITGTNLIGQTLNVYVDGVLATAAVVSSAASAEATISLPANATQTAINHMLTVYLNGVEVTGQSSTVTVGAAPIPPVLTPTAPSETNSNHIDLAKLTLSASGKALTLSPLFSPQITEYKAETDADQIEVKWATAHPKAIVKRSGESIDNGTTNVPLLMGANVLALTVLAEDGRTKQYTITITRVAKNDNTVPPTYACPFTDLENHWAKSSICEAASRVIVEGVSETTFEPNRDVTRAEFAIMLQRTLEIPIQNADTSALPFNDEASIPEWARLAIQTAVSEGILTGYPDGTLRPLQKVKRTEMAVMISKAMKWKTDSTKSLFFSDEEKIPDWAKPYVEATREHGILAGRAGNQFVPDGLTTRAEAAVALLRLWNRLH